MVTHRFSYALLGALLCSGPCLAQRVELLDFYLPTCQPCRAMAPTVQQIAAAGVPVRKIDGSQDIAAAQRFRVSSYPTFVAVVDGREIGRIEGATSYAYLAELVRRSEQIAQRGVASPVSSQTFAAAPQGERSFTVGADHGPGFKPLDPLPPAESHSSGAAKLIASSVRLTVEDSQGKAYGTGTIVDARDGAALVVTCAHLFRDASGRPLDVEGKLTLELFDGGSGSPRVVKRLAGHLVSQDFDADVALVSFWTDGDVATSPVASTADSPQRGDPVRSVGCDLGALPTVRESQVVDLNRYQGPPNIEATGAPVQGRSGGGLFDRAGRLVGVCFAADEPADEGLYAGLASIHAQLAKVGLQSLYEAATPPVGLAQAKTVPVAPAAENPPSQMAPVAAADEWPEPVVRGAAPAEPIDTAALTAGERATLAEITRRAEASEVVLMIRGKEPGSGTEVVTIDSASPEFVSAVRSLGASTVVR